VVAVPSFRAARRKIQDMMVVNNLKQIWHAAQLYFLENGVEEVIVDNLVWYVKPNGTLVDIAEESYTSTIKCIRGEDYSQVYMLGGDIRAMLMSTLVNRGGVLFANIADVVYYNQYLETGNELYPGHVYASADAIGVPDVGTDGDSKMTFWSHGIDKVFHLTRLDLLERIVVPRMPQSEEILTSEPLDIVAKIRGVLNDIQSLFEDYGRSLIGHTVVESIFSDILSAIPAIVDRCEEIYTFQINDMYKDDEEQIRAEIEGLIEGINQCYLALTNPDHPCPDDISWIINEIKACYPSSINPNRPLPDDIYARTLLIGTVFDVINGKLNRLHELKALLMN
jgi:hypothetical protein